MTSHIHVRARLASRGKLPSASVSSKQVAEAMSLLDVDEGASASLTPTATSTLRGTLSAMRDDNDRLRAALLSADQTEQRAVGVLAQVRLCVHVCVRMCAHSFVSQMSALVTQLQSTFGASG